MDHSRPCYTALCLLKKDISFLSAKAIKICAQKKRKEKAFVFNALQAPPPETPIVEDRLHC